MFNLLVSGASSSHDFHRHLWFRGSQHGIGVRNLRFNTHLFTKEIYSQLQASVSPHYPFTDFKFENMTILHALDTHT